MGLFTLILSSTFAVALGVPLSTIANAIEPKTNIIRACTQFRTPQHDPNVARRRAEIEENRLGYLYGPSLIGNFSYFPRGNLGDALVKNDIAIFEATAAPINKAADLEAEKTLEGVLKKDRDLKSLEDYTDLYRGQWSLTEPNGTSVGALTNYTQDLFFSMERLSANPYSIRRLNPHSDKLPYIVEDKIVQALAGKTLNCLFSEGRLFVADHSDIKPFESMKIKDRYTAFCTALFYICPIKNQLLPLAIKTNTGADLIYTPLDTPGDWLLAKIMFNSNDLFQGQIYHLVATHALAEIVYLAALRTLASSHPVFAYLKRVMFQAFAIRPVGSQVLFNPGGGFDAIFSLSTEAAQAWGTKRYHSGAGSFRSTYLYTDFKSRGLVDCPYGPKLPHFPWLSDAGAIYSTIRSFTKKFVQTYYQNDETVCNDPEIQAWVFEANGPAAVIDFPHSIHTRAMLVDVLTHVSYLAAIAHNTLNINEGFANYAVLPSHPTALHNPIPTEKGVISVLPWLPNLQLSITQITTVTEFNRPQVANTGLDVVAMFDNFKVCGQKDVMIAVQEFQGEMVKISRRIQAKKFDKDGLSQGAPFLWKVLDPRAVPFYLAV